MRVSVAAPRGAGNASRQQARCRVWRTAWIVQRSRSVPTPHSVTSRDYSTFHVLAHTLVSHWICILYVEYVARVGQHHAAHAQPPSFNTALALTGWTVLCIL